MKKTSSETFLSFKTMRGAFGAAKRALRSGTAYRDAKRRLAARIRVVLQSDDRRACKTLAAGLLMQVIVMKAVAS